MLQVPVDVAFIVIAVLSQGAWIFRWSMEHNGLGACMVALMAMNAALIQVICPARCARCAAAHAAQSASRVAGCAPQH